MEIPKYVTPPDEQPEAQEGWANQLRARELQKQGWVRCSTYHANMARKVGIQPDMSAGEHEMQKNLGRGEKSWIPAWLLWYFVRPSDMTPRDRVATAVAVSTEGRLTLLYECALARYRGMSDTDADLSVEQGIERLHEELQLTLRNT